MPAVVAAFPVAFYLAYFLLNDEGRKAGPLRGLWSLAVYAVAFGAGAAVWYFIPCGSKWPGLPALGAVCGLFSAFAIIYVFDPEWALSQWGPKPSPHEWSPSLQENHESDEIEEPQRQISATEAGGFALVIALLLAVPVYLNAVVVNTPAGSTVTEDAIMRIGLIGPPLIGAAFTAVLFGIHGTTDLRSSSGRSLLISISVLLFSVVGIEMILQYQ